MTKQRITIFSVGSALILVLGLLISYLSTVISSSNASPIVLPSAPELSTGDIPDASYEDGESYATPLLVKINPDNVQQVISSMSRQEEYSAKLSVSLFWTGGSSESLRDIYSKNGYVCVVSGNSEGFPEKYVIYGNNYYFSWLNGNDHFYQGASGVSTPDDIQSVPTYENLVNLPKDNISSAGYNVWNGFHCISVETTVNELDYRDIYRISLENGLLVGFERYEKDSLVMSVIMNEYSAEPPEDTFFSLPHTLLAWEV